LSEELNLDADLLDIFPISRRRKRNVRPAAELLQQHRKAIVDKVAYWSGAQRPLVKTLLESIEKRVAELKLLADVNTEDQHLIEVTVFATALAMNYVSRGKFVLP
jgi:hypothetical protein